MRPQLEVLRLANEDVIATSCNSYYFGNVIHTDEGNNFYIYNKEDKTWDDVDDIVVRPTELPTGNNESFYYHCDEDGNFIEWCDKEKINHGYNMDAMEKVHGPVNNCLAVGTKISMADGSVKNIEDIKEGDSVLTFNHEKGEYEGQKVSLVWKCEEPKCPFTLKFADGNSISVIGDHSFFEKEELKYVSVLEDNAKEFIGKHFYNATKKEYVELVDVVYETEAVDHYEIYSEYNSNCIAENMLNVPYDCSMFLNIYKFNEDLSIDHDELEKDINEFGLLEYPEDANYSKEIFDTFRWKYAKVAIGKGLTTWDVCNSGKADLIKLKK